MLRYGFICFGFTFFLYSNAQESDRYTLVWYNLENAFDTIDSPDTNDSEYLPDSPKKWDSMKYWVKLNRMAQVLRNAGGYAPPDFIAVCEVENNQVLYDLSRRSSLRRAEYRIIHYESPDHRGIDVGILYRPDRIHMFYSEAITVRFPDHPEKATRDILFASGVMGQDTVHFFINHWPSRRGGQQYSEPFRMTASKILRNKVDSIFDETPGARIIITGDFNDGPDSRSIEHLAAHSAEERVLHVEMKGRNPGTGTHRYRGEWEYLDQWIWSAPLQGDPFRVDTAYVYSNERLTEPSASYPGVQPKRCWSGSFFRNGYSDHLPIVLKLIQTYRSKIE